MSGINTLLTVPSPLLEMLRQAETASGLPMLDIDLKRSRKGRRELLVWFFGVHETPEALLPGMRAIAESLGVALDTSDPHRSETTPSGRIVCLMVTLTVEDVCLVVRALIDAEQYAQAVAAEQQLAGVAA